MLVTATAMRSPGFTPSSFFIIAAMQLVIWSASL